MIYSEGQNLSSADAQLAVKIAGAQSRLAKKLRNIDVSSLGISEYNQRYLTSSITMLESLLPQFGSLIYEALQNHHSDIERTALADYGGGSGIISLLASELGVGTVIYNDIYDVSCTDAATLSKALNLKADHYVCGDADEFVSYLNQNQISVDAIVSYDVLEHVYDVKWHFEQLRRLTNDNYKVAYASGANPENPRYVKSVKQKQIEVETIGQKMTWGHKARDTKCAYFVARREIISSHAPELESHVIEYLAQVTRGLICNDIEAVVDEFRHNGSVSYQMTHPTNTCDPHTGNWCEHLMELNWLELTIQTAGFSINIIPGKYSVCGTIAKRSLKNVFNILIGKLGRGGMFLAPYYLVVARPSSQVVAHHLESNRAKKRAGVKSAQ